MLSARSIWKFDGKFGEMNGVQLSPMPTSSLLKSYMPTHLILLTLALATCECMAASSLPC